MVERMLKDVLQYLEQHTNQALETVKQLVRIPSVAAKGEGIEETATLLKSMFEELGMKTQLSR